MSADAPPPAGDAPPPPPPGIGGAFAFSVVAWFVTVTFAAPLLGWASLPTALAVGAVVGFGGVGTLVARRLPAPAEQTLGMRGFPLRFLGVLALLVPAAILTSEIDNWVALALPRPAPEAGAGGEAGAAEPLSGWLVAEGVIAMVLLRPVVEEFFFRGVLFHGLVANHGAAVAVAVAALLSAASEAAFAAPLGSSRLVAAGLEALLVGALLGGVRVASGSLLAPILLQSALRAFGALAVLLHEHLPIPGFNVPGDHTPLGVLLPALACVATGTLLLRRHP